MKVMRLGKTAKDRAAGAASRNASNKRERVEYQHEQGLLPAVSRGKGFPSHTCNGKSNHRRYTGKGNKTVINF